MSSIEHFQKFFDQLSGDRIDPAFAHFPQILTKHLVIADALRQISHNTWQTTDEPTDWARALLGHLATADKDFALVMPLIPEGGQPIADIEPGELWEIERVDIINVINIVLRVPVSFVKNAGGKICGWKVGTEDFFIQDIASLEAWLRVVGYVRDEEIPVLSDDDFYEV
jgi:hypothetical protein